MRNFSGVTTLPYKGTLFNQPANSNSAGFGQQQELPPVEVVTQFNWASYGASTTVPNISATCNLNAKGPQQLLDRIRSVRIDNLGNPVPVYVYFPDTNYTVVAPPNTVVWEPVKTGQFTAQVIGLGFTDNNIGSTAVYFCNFFAAPFIDYEFATSSPLWLASSNITRGGTIYNQNYGVPALGDQTIQYNPAITAPGILQNNLMGTPYAGGFLYLTHVDFSLNNISVGGGLNGLLEFVMESTGTAGVLYDLIYGVNNPAGFTAALGTQKMLNFSSMNIKLDATQTYRLRCISLSHINAQLQAAFNFTTNPN